MKILKRWCFWNYNIPRIILDNKNKTLSINIPFVLDSRRKYRHWFSDLRPQKKKTWQRIRPPWKLFLSDTSGPWQAFVHLGRVNGTLCVRVSRPRFCHFVAAVKLDAIRDEKKKGKEKEDRFDGVTGRNSVAINRWESPTCRDEIHP